MKRCIFLLLLSVFTLNLNATTAEQNIQETPSYEDVEKLQDKVSGFLLAMEGVNGNGITLCDPVTGKIFTEVEENIPLQYCLNIMTETQEAKDALDALFPAVTKVDGIIVFVQKVGRISAGG